MKFYHLIADVEDEKHYNKIWELEPNSLNNTEVKVVRLRAQGYTFSEIGSKLGFTKSWANEVLISAIKKMKVSNE